MNLGTSRASRSITSGRMHALTAAASLAIGRPVEALDAVRRARRFKGNGSPIQSALQEGDALLRLQRYPEVLEVVARAVAKAVPDTDTRARLKLMRAEALWHTGRTTAARSEAARGSRDAVEAMTRARGQELLGFIAWKAQDFDAAWALLQASFDLYQQADSIEGQVRALGHRANALREAGRLDDARATQESRVRTAAATTRLDLLAVARSDEAALLTVIGDWAEARRQAEAAAALFRELGDLREHTQAGLRRAAVELAAGSLAAARSLAEAAATALQTSPDDRGNAEMLLLRADLELSSGNGRAADEAASAALLVFEQMRDAEGICRARVRRAQSLLMNGEGERALREARRAVAEAPVARGDLRCMASLVQGQVFLRAGQLDLSQAAFCAAVDASAVRASLAPLARLGLALARGATRSDPAVTVELIALEASGDRRLAAAGLAELARRDGVVPRSPAGDEPVRAELCRLGGTLATAIRLARGEDGATHDPMARWAAAMATIRVLVPWQRATLTSAAGGWCLEAARPEPRLLEPGLAHLAAGGCTAPRRVDLVTEPSLWNHPERALRRATIVLLAPARGGAVAGLELGLEPPGEALALLAELATFLPSLPDPRTETPAPAFPAIVGRCEPMQELFRAILRVAASDEPVHVFGETGTGKERVARAIHDRSARAGGPFVVVNASSLSDEAFESEMCGHIKGSYTGAIADRAGFIADAHGGTLFLDEVADLSPRAQNKLMRIVEEKAYRRFGESQMRRSDFRIVTAANQPLEARVAARAMREDLMFRLDVLRLTLPPLRERGTDLALLARHFVREACTRAGRPVAELPQSLLHALQRYDWPGNVRELQTAMAVLVTHAAGGPLMVEHLPARVRGQAPRGQATSLRAAVAAFEREHVAAELARNQGNRVRTAAALGLSRQALLVKIRKLGL